MRITTSIGRLRWAAILEGISYLLLGVTMPLKYLYDLPEPNFVVGMAHGVLFMVYGMLTLQNSIIHRWGFRITLLLLAASLFPFATFYADHTFLRRQQDASSS